ncbi:hypothetical protein DFH11DRAFT_316985 [Phellopilus nigrolimitatus]|nr:hypothetical protein DFH11DRAFT_316985 [Phellopilus nigrolimitatus]
MRDMKGFVRLRSWLLDLVSLDLHVLTDKGVKQRVKDFLDLLFGATDLYHESENDWEHDIFWPLNNVSQSRIRLIELFQSLESEWYDSITVTLVDLQFYTTLNLQSCVRVDENGCEIVDHTGLFEFLSNAHRTLLRQSQIANTSHNTQLDAETRCTLESCVVENNLREVLFALNVSYESWNDWPTSYSRNPSVVLLTTGAKTSFTICCTSSPPAIRITVLPESSAILLFEVLFTHY